MKGKKYSAVYPTMRKAFFQIFKFEYLGEFEEEIKIMGYNHSMAPMQQFDEK